MDALEGFEDYGEPGWDGDGALPILASTIDSARQFLGLLNPSMLPNIAPGPDGTIGFEWRFTGGPMQKLFVEIGEREVRAYAVKDA